MGRIYICFFFSRFNFFVHIHATLTVEKQFKILLLTQQKEQQQNKSKIKQHKFFFLLIYTLACIRLYAKY